MKLTRKEYVEYTNLKKEWEATTKHRAGSIIDFIFMKLAKLFVKVGKK